MKRMIIAAALAVGMSGTAAYAVDLSNLSGQSCGAFEGTWHFVNNQTGTTDPGLLSASFTSGTQVNISPSKVTPGGVHHFYVIAVGTLTGASTNLDGRLVLSDFVCDDKKPEPPK